MPLDHEKQNSAPGNESHHRQTVLLFEDKLEHAQKVYRFIVEGLEAGEGVLVIARKSLLTSLNQLLESYRLNGRSVTATKFLALIEAEECLSKFMIEGMPHRSTFFATIGKLVSSLHSNFGAVRAYGELVELLMEEGRYHATIVVEDMWNQLLGKYSVSHFCPYPMKNFADAEQKEGFRRNCNTHSTVLSVDGYMQHLDQSHAMQELQQQILSLQAELAEKQQAEQRFYLACEAGGVGTWAYQLPSEEFLACRQFASLLGLPREAYRGSIDIFWQKLHPEDQVHARARFKKALEGQENYEDQFRVIHANGEIRWLVNRGRIVRGNEGQVLEVIGVTIDITAQKNAEERHRRAKEEAEAANQAKSAFLANMSHEIRTPLSAILGFSEMIKDPRVDEDERQQFIDVIIRNGRELTALIDDILDLSKVESGHLEIETQRFSLSSMLSDISTSFSVKAHEKAINLAIEADPLLPDTIESDPTRLRQILNNIIGNAIKFTDAGSVRVIVKPLYTDSPNPQIAFYVLDTGCGISSAGVSKLFKPFSQADSSTTRRYGGTGLGLALSQKLAQSLGGDIKLVKSELGKGSTFLITIAAGQEKNSKRKAASPARKTRASAPKQALAGVKILLADDTPDNQLLLKRMLNASGARVDVVDNGVDAVEAALSGQHDIVLMDIQMPKLDGLNATRELRSKAYKTPIIALTAHAMIEERNRCLQAGCNDHLPKPVSYQGLLQMISQYLPTDNLH